MGPRLFKNKYLKLRAEYTRNINEALTEKDVDFFLRQFFRRNLYHYYRQDIFNDYRIYHYGLCDN